MPHPVWVVEAWTLPGVGTFSRKLASVPYTFGSFAVEVAGPGRGNLVLDGSFDIDTLLSDTEGSLVRVFENVSGSLVERQSFYARRWSRIQQEDTDSVYTVTGPGVGDVLSSAVVYAFDHPADPTVQPDWRWGGENTYLKNVLFDAQPLTFDFDDDDDGGAREATSVGETNPLTGDPEISTDEASSGTKSLKFDPDGISGAPHSGVEWDVDVDGNGRRIQWDIKLKSNTTGRRFVAFVIPDPKGGGTHHSTNGFTYNGVYYVELDNVARAAAKDGNPGGSTDGTWQTFEMDVTLPIGQFNMQVGVIYDHHALPDNGPVSYLDDWVLAGNGIGLTPPWESLGTMTDWNIEAHPTLGPALSIHHDPTGADWTGSHQLFTVTPGKTVTISADIYHTAGADRSFRVQLTRDTGGGIIAVDTVAVPSGVVTTIEVAAVIPDGVTAVRWQVRTDTAISDEYWLTAPSVFDGLPQATAGTIWQQLMDDAAVDHIAESGVYIRDHLGFLKYDSFDGATDSNSVAWPETLFFRAQQGKSYLQVMNDFAALGYEWEVVWNDGAGQYELKLYVPYDPVTKTGGIGANVTGVAVTWGAGVTGGPLVRSEPSGTASVARGAAGILGFATDATAITNFGRRELAELDSNLLAVTTVQALADQILVERLSQTTGHQTTLAGDVANRPLRDYGKGDRISTQSQFGVVDRRIRKIETTIGEDTNYSLDFDRSTFGGASGGAEAIRRLLLKFDGLADEQPPSELAVESEQFRGPIEPTFLVASSTTRPEIQAVADFVCAGVDDKVEIQAAFDALPAGGGRVMLTEGTFVIRAGTEVGAWAGALTMPANTSLVGTGAGTVLDIASTVSGTIHYGIKMGANCQVSDLTVDISNTSSNLYAVGQDDANSRIHHCSFHGMSSSGGDPLWYVLSDNNGTVSECHFVDIDDTGIELYDATVTDCAFTGTAVAIEIFGNDAIFSNNRLAGALQVKLNYASYTQITGNIFNATSISAPYLYIAGGYGVVVSGNYFDGNSDESQEVISIGGGYQGLSIVGNILSSGVLLDRGDSSEDGLTILGNTWIAGGGFLMDTGAVNWRYSDFLIAHNNMDAWHYGGSAFIHLLGSAAYLHGISIVNNVLSSTSVNAGAGPLIDVSFPDTTTSNGRAIRIVGNKVVDRRGAAFADLAIRVTGPTTKTDGSVEVSRNHVEASDGIEITYIRDLVCKSNVIAVEEVASQQTFYAGQIKVANCGTAVVDDNVVVSGEDGDKAGTGAAISVEAVAGGSVRDNDVWGIVDGALDTALSVDGPFYVSGNAYHGEHSLNTGTPFPTELAIVGTGATIGENQMDTDVSGGTGWRRSSAVWQLAPEESIEAVGVTDTVLDVLT